MSGNRVFRVQSVAEYLIRRGRPTEVVDIVNDSYGDLANLLKDLPVAGYYGTQYLGSLTYAYSQAGMEEESRLLFETMRSVLDTQGARGSDSWIYWSSEAQYEALSGNSDAAIAHLQTMLDRGLVAVTILDPAFDTIRDDERFVAIEAAALRRANEERMKLGMSPYESPILFN
jgi:hypothetical protein